MLDNWQRIEKIVNRTGLSVNAFARGIGLKRAENLYQIKKGNHGISRELADLICTKYPMVDKGWLLTGSGEAFIDERTASDTFPFYRTDAVRMLLTGEFPNPDSLFTVPALKGCEMAALNVSRAMEPQIPIGAVVMLRKVDPRTIHPGNIYLVVASNFSGIRVVRREPDSRFLRLVARNGEEFDPVLITVDRIERLYEVLGYMVI